MKTFLRGSATLLAIGIGLLTPTASHTIEPLSYEPSSQSSLAQTAVTSAAFPRLDEQGFNERIQSDGQTPYEITFRGSENELVTVYYNAINGISSHGARVHLYLEATGEEIYTNERYIRETNLDELEGHHRTYRLPTTGEYRLAFHGNLLRHQENEPALKEYLLKLRVAPYFERLMMHINKLFIEDEYEAVMPFLAEAIAQQPDHPLPYFSRAFAQGAIAWNNQPDEFIEQIDEDRPAALSVLFESLSAEEQQQLLSDLRRTSENYLQLVEVGHSPAEELGFEPRRFAELADYLETGTLSEEIRDLINSY